MIVETTARVVSLKIAERLGFVYLDDGSAMPEIFVLWWAGIVDRPEVRSGKRVTSSLWVSIIRSAMERNQPIRVRHDEDGTVVLAVYLDASP